MSSPHPLAQRLIERLQTRPASRVLDFATGSGRNAEALRRAGFDVVAIGDEAAVSERPLAATEDGFVAAISTHGFLHGTSAGVAARVRAVVRALEPGGLLYATFGSTKDSRFGEGERLGDATFAPLAGDERGVSHVYFDRRRLLEMLEPQLDVESLEEQSVDDVAGAWAHRGRSLAGAAHWFAVARKR